jgi:RNA polymerase sigma factor for flagellar operon FliA
LSSERPAKGPDENELWSRYLRGRERAAYDRLVEHYLPLVKVVAGRLALHLPGSVREEDLYSAGCVGLLSAVENFDPARDVRFETYALSRIRGAMLDELRATDVLTRAVRERAGKIRQAERRLRQEDRELSPETVADAAGLTLDEMCETERALSMASWASLDDEADDEGHSAASLVVDESAERPPETIERQELLGLLRGALSDKDRLLIVLYYHEELTLREIGDILGVSESRVSQMHTEMIKRLHYKLEVAGRGQGGPGGKPTGRQPTGDSRPKKPPSGGWMA